MIRIALFLLATTWASFVCACDPEAQIDERPFQTAWWLRIRFMPCDSEIYGISVQKIHPSWHRASALQQKYIPKSAFSQSSRNALQEGKLKFELSGDFNRDGHPDRVLVGVYETKGGESGRFLLIVTRTETGAWNPVFLDLFPGRPGFLALARNRSSIELWSCMECDAVSN